MKWDSSLSRALLMTLISQLAVVEFSLAGDSARYSIRRENALTFNLESENLSRNQIQYAFEIVDSDEDPTQVKGFESFLPLDSGRNWMNRGKESYYVLLSKVAYEVNKDISFFSQSQATDLRFVQAMMPEIPVKKTDQNTFFVESAFASRPSYRILVQTFSRDQVMGLSSDHPIRKAMARDSALRGEIPDWSVVQTTDQFGTVMGARTSKVSYVLTKHYRVRAGRTLVVTQIFGLLYNVPPFFAGGAGRLHSDFSADFLALPSRINAY